MIQVSDAHRHSGQKVLAHWVAEGHIVYVHYHNEMRGTAARNI